MAQHAGPPHLKQNVRATTPSFAENLRGDVAVAETRAGTVAPSRRPCICNHEARPQLGERSAGSRCYQLLRPFPLLVSAPSGSQIESALSATEQKPG
jgi:hypothetical protein